MRDPRGERLVVATGDPAGITATRGRSSTLRRRPEISSGDGSGSSDAPVARSLRTLTGRLFQKMRFGRARNASSLRSSSTEKRTRVEALAATNDSGERNRGRMQDPVSATGVVHDCTRRALSPSGRFVCRGTAGPRGVVRGRIVANSLDSTGTRRPTDKRGATLRVAHARRLYVRRDH